MLAVPGTQVSVERLFSQLTFILNDRRERITEENLNNVLLVRTNYRNLKDCFLKQNFNFNT